MLFVVYATFLLSFDTHTIHVESSSDFYVGKTPGKYGWDYNGLDFSWMLWREVQALQPQTRPNHAPRLWPHLQHPGFQISGYCPFALPGSVAQVVLVLGAVVLVMVLLLLPSGAGLQPHVQETESSHHGNQKVGKEGLVAGAWRGQKDFVLLVGGCPPQRDAVLDHLLRQIPMHCCPYLLRSHHLHHSVCTSTTLPRTEGPDHRCWQWGQIPAAEGVRKDLLGWKEDGSGRLVAVLVFALTKHPGLQRRLCSVHWGPHRATV